MRRCLLALAAVTLALPAAARAQNIADYDYTNLEFRGAGAGVGFIWPTKVTSTPVYFLRTDLGFLGPGVRIAPSLSYWRSDMKLSELDKLASRVNSLQALRDRGITLTGRDLGPVRWAEVALDVDGEYVVTTPGGILTYGGLGLGVHALRGSGSSIDDTFVQDLLNTLSPALTALGGAEYRIGSSARVFAEARLTAAGDVNYAAIRFGGMYMLPGRHAAVRGTAGGAH